MDRRSYMAAIAEVKGNFTIRTDGNVEFSFTTRDHEIPLRVREFVGTGQTRSTTNGSDNVSYKYTLARRADVDALARILIPRLTAKARTSAENVRSHLDAWFSEVDPTSPQREIRVTL